MLKIGQEVYKITSQYIDEHYPKYVQKVYIVAVIQTSDKTLYLTNHRMTSEIQYHDLRFAKEESELYTDFKECGQSCNLENNEKNLRLVSESRFKKMEVY